MKRQSVLVQHSMQPRSTQLISRRHNPCAAQPGTPAPTAHLEFGLVGGGQQRRLLLAAGAAKSGGWAKWGNEPPPAINSIMAGPAGRCGGQKARNSTPPVCAPLQVVHLLAQLGQLALQLLLLPQLLAQHLLQGAEARREEGAQVRDGLAEAHARGLQTNQQVGLGVQNHTVPSKNSTARDSAVTRSVVTALPHLVDGLGVQLLALAHLLAAASHVGLELLLLTRKRAGGVGVRG